MKKFIFFSFLLVFCLSLGACASNSSPESLGSEQALDATGFSGTPLRTLADKQGLKIGFFPDTERMNPSDKRYDSTYVKNLNSVAASNFNIVTMPVYMSQVHFDQAKFDYTEPDLVLNWATKNKVQVHGHPLVYHLDSILPPWVKDLEKQKNYPELRRVLEKHVKDIVTKYKGKVAVWDAINEAIEYENGKWGYRSSLWQSAFSQDGEADYSLVDDSFRWAHAVDDKAKLLYNDYAVAELNPKSDFMYEMLKGMVARNVPVDGVGFQMHLSANGSDDFTGLPLNLDGFSANMRRFAELGLDIYITELDMGLANNSKNSFAKQAEVYRGIMNRCILEPRCKSVQTWGFYDKYTWLDWFENPQKIKMHPLLFDVNAKAKPAFYAFQNELAGFSGTMRLQNYLSKNYLNVAEKTNYAKVLGYESQTQWWSQQWVLEAKGRGIFRLKNRWTGRYLHASEDVNKALVLAAPSVASWTSQQWQLEYAGKNTYRLKNLWTGRYLYTSSTENNASVSVRNFTGYVTQRWILRPAN